MTRVTTQEHGVDRTRHRRKASAEWWALLLAAVFTALLGVALPAEPDRVSVTITNTTDSVLYIDASTVDDDTSTLVTSVPAHSTRTADVIDRGAEWVLHLRTLGSLAATIDVSRADLVDNTFTTPAWLNDDLIVRGVPALTDSGGSSG